jgi:hypothetical protein
LGILSTPHILRFVCNGGSYGSTFPAHFGEFTFYALR